MMRAREKIGEVKKIGKGKKKKKVIKPARSLREITDDLAKFGANTETNTRTNTRTPARTHTRTHEHNHTRAHA